MTKLELADISLEDFQAYEEVRASGVVNMLSSQVEDLAGISREVKVGIMQHYSALNEKWPEVRSTAQSEAPVFQEDEEY